MVDNSGFSSSGSENLTSVLNIHMCQTLLPILDLKARESLPGFYVITAITSIILNIFTSCAAMVLNSIVILALWLTPSLRHEPKNILLCSLASSDFFVGFISQPSFFIAEISLISRQMELYCYSVFIHFYTSWIFSGISFLTLSAISIERYLALRFHLRYVELITTARVTITVSAYWLIWVTWITILWFGGWNGVLNQAIIALCVLLVIVDGLCYYAIYKSVRRHNSQIRQLTSQDQKDMARYRRSTATMVFLVCAFAGSYLPFAITTGVSALQDKEDMRTSAAHSLAVAFVSANSCINPLIYFWRVRELREAAKRALSKRRLVKPGNRIAGSD